MQLTRQQQHLSLIAIIASAFCVGMSLGVGFPLTSLTLAAWGEPDWLIGLAGGLPAIAVLAVLPVLTSVATRLGAVEAIVAGCGVSAVGFIALYYFQSTPAWLIIRFIMSAASALPWLVGETWANKVTSDASRGKVLAAFSVFFFLGFLVGPLFLSFTGITGVAPFLFGAGSTIATILPVIAAKRLAPILSKDENIGVLRCFKLVPVGMIGGFLSGVSEISYFSLLPNVGLASGLPEKYALELVSILTAGGITLQVLVGWLSDRVNRQGMMFSMTFAMLAVSAFLPWVIPHNVAGPIVLFLLGGVILGFYTVSLAIVAEAVEPQFLTSANAAFLVTYQLGAIAGPLSAGSAMAIDPVLGFVGTVSALMIAGALALLYLMRRKSSSNA